MANDPTVREFLKRLTAATLYEQIVFVVVLVDVVKICFETDLLAAAEANYAKDAFRATDMLTLILIGLYILDMAVRWLSEGRRYIHTMYNIVDIAVVVVNITALIVSTWVLNYHTWLLLRLLRASRILRVFRVIPLIRGLQVVVDALLTTLSKNAIDVLYLLFMVIFMFAMFGHHFFGASTHEEAVNDWGSLGSSFMTLWIFVCADGWTPYQEHLENAGYSVSFVFVVFFIFIGNFIIGNLFVGVICQVRKCFFCFSCMRFEWFDD